jgi:cytochrome c biogenesis protein CcmG, thiol:disulfide interchange protein DsbE
MSAEAAGIDEHRVVSMSARRLGVLGVWLAGAAAIAALALFGLSSSSPPAGGRLAPALPREALTGRPTSLASLLSGAHGRPTFVVFWASWCTSCAQEAPALERFQHSAEGRGRLVAVDWSDPRTGEARAFVRRYGWSFPVMRDAEGLVGNDYGLGPGLPVTFVVDANGRIGQVLHGPQSVASLRMAMRAAERA